MAALQQTMGQCCLLACSSEAFVERETLLQGLHQRLPEQLTAESARADDSYLPLPEPYCSSRVEGMMQQPDAVQAAAVMLVSLLHHWESVKFASASEGLQQKSKHHQHNAAGMHWLPELHACNHHHHLLLLQAAEDACLAEMSG